MTCRRLRYYRQKSGNVLIFVLWVVIFLSVTALALGQQAQLCTALIENNIRRDKAQASAWAGIISVLDELRADPLVSERFNVEDRTVFHHGEINGGRFDVFYKQGSQRHDGIQNEEAKINLNALTVQTSLVLVELLRLLDVDEERSRIVASSVVDWHDDDRDPTDHGFGAEDEYYGQLPKSYRCKNAPFESLEELRLVRGVSEESYEKMKDYVTIYPRSASRLGVNVQTAPAIVIQAFARSLVGGYGRLTIDDADELTRKIVDFRRGDGNMGQTGEGRKLDAALMGLTSSQKILFQKMLPFLKADRSNYFTVRSRGTYKTAVIDLEAVIRRQDLSVLAWRMTGD